MMMYRTMTVDGLTGNSYQAESFEEADVLATADGYDVLDYVDDDILVVL